MMEATTSKRTAPKAAAAEPKAPKAVLAIAGSDPSGGALPENHMIRWKKSSVSARQMDLLQNMALLTLR